MFRLFRSSAFRMTLLYMVTFGASVTGLLIFLYTSIVDELREEMKHSIRMQMSGLQRAFILGGERETVATLKQTLEKDVDKTMALMLIDRNWHVLAGNIARWPGGKTNVNQWIIFPLGKPANPSSGAPANLPQTARGPKVMALNATLPGGYILLVGRRMDRLQHVENIIVEVLYLCFSIMFLISALGGMLLSWTIHRKVEVINQTFRKVAAGALDARAPVTGMGDEFDRLAMHLNQTLMRIGELMDGVRDISYGVAHDLRTPLTRLRQRIEHMSHDPFLPQALAEETRRCLNDIDTLVGTFNAILRIAQAESGASLAQFASFDLAQVVNDVAELYRPVAEEKSQSLTVACDLSVNMHGERHLMTQMIANILDNAIKYTPCEGHIEVALRRNDGKIILSIRDDGIGIPAEYHAKVLQKFFRMEQSRSSPGNGLGLSLAEAAVKLHHGSLRLIDHQPGLTVEITLPCG